VSLSRLGAIGAGLVLLLLAACTSSPTVVPDGPPVSGAPAALPALSEITKLSAAKSDQFLIQQLGSNFAPELGRSNTAANGALCDFSPSFGPGASDLSAAAFCIYRLTYDSTAAPIKLKAEWDSAPGDYWVALSDWTVDRWKWHAMPASGELNINNPARYCDLNGQCFVAVVLLGESPASLSKIGFGEPLPAGPAGYTLLAPLNAAVTHLLDMDGEIVHSWNHTEPAGAAAVLEENGHLLRQANVGNPTFTGGGTGGLLEEYDWDGNLVWSYELSDNTYCTHHDFCRLPNGNVLLIVWTRVDDVDVIEAGRDPATITAGKFWSETIIEVEPTLPSGGNIVWQWEVMDHVVQDFDNTKAHYGDPGEHPELIDLNYPPGSAGDWIHFNCVNYNAEFDQVILTTPFFNEVWVIDHSTTTAEAASHSGGQYGRGGDLLYRWGNPEAYRQGSGTDKKLFFCHDAHWIEAGLAGAGNVLIFNNQGGLAEGRNYTTVIELTLPQNPDGSYYMDGNVFGPSGPAFEFKADPPEDFFSPLMSSAQRLPGGGLLLCKGPTGLLIEVNAAGEEVWSYQNEIPNLTAPVFQALRYAYDYSGVDAL
jgi:hypothetical protein